MNQELKKQNANNLDVDVSNIYDDLPEAEKVKGIVYQGKVYFLGTYFLSRSLAGNREPVNKAAYDICREWLQFFGTKTVNFNPKHLSTKLTTAVEIWAKNTGREIYSINDGDFIAAAILEGYNVKPIPCAAGNGQDLYTAIFNIKFNLKLGALTMAGLRGDCF